MMIDQMGNFGVSSTGPSWRWCLEPGQLVGQSRGADVVRTEARSATAELGGSDWLLSEFRQHATATQWPRWLHVKSEFRRAAASRAAMIGSCLHDQTFESERGWRTPKCPANPKGVSRRTSTGMASAQCMRRIRDDVVTILVENHKLLVDALQESVGRR
jgi:hypothetical protein